MDMQKMSPESNGCQHHWMIETALDYTSWGKCKKCGEEREFNNWVGTDEINTQGMYGINLQFAVYELSQIK